MILGDCVLCPLFQPVSERCPQALLPCTSPACSWAGLCPLDKWKFLDLWRGQERSVLDVSVWRPLLPPPGPGAFMEKDDCASVTWLDPRGHHRLLIFVQFL